MAALPVAPGLPQNASVLSPEIWIPRYRIKFYKQTCLDKITDTEYEGDISGKGCKVIVRKLGDGTIRDIVKGQDIVYDNPEDSTQEMEINKGKYWAIAADDVDKIQADVKFMEAWTDNHTKLLKIAVEVDVFGNVYSDAHASNKGIAAGADSANIDLGASSDPRLVNRTNVVDLYNDIVQVLDEQSVPPEDAFIVVPPCVKNVLMKSDLRVASLTGDSTSPVRNGRIGVVADLDTYVSRNLTSVADGSGYTAYHCIAGHKKAICFASQLNRVERLRNPKAFGDLARMEFVYGYEVFNPETLLDVYIAIG